MQYKLLLYDYKKLLLRLLVTLTPCIFVAPIITLTLHDYLNQKELATVMIIAFLLMPIAVILSLQGVYFKETIELKSTSFFSEKYGDINLIDIKKIKFESYRGLRIRLYLKNGMTLGLSPATQFSSKANNEFWKFYTELKSKHETIAG